MVGKVLVGDGQGAAVGKLVDGGAPVVDWQGDVADELCWSKAKLLGCLEGVGKHWSGGSTMDRRSPEKKGSAAVVECRRRSLIGLFIAWRLRG
jgi:hypothetical protein